MTLDELIGSLERSNPQYEKTVADLQHVAEISAMFLAHKGPDLVEVVSGFCADDRCPVIDKKLGIVAGCGGGFHEDLREVLCRYHAARSEDSSLKDQDLAARYVAEGYGYYVSSMFPKTVLTGETYRPDRFDTDLFLVYDVRHIG